jgi:proteasome lid subunit RPN8/RPN11
MLTISTDLIEKITAHLEAAYPEEGAGFLLGVDGEVRAIIALPNAREDDARHNRYLITPEDYLKAEMKAAETGRGFDRRIPFAPRLPERAIRI